MPKYDLAVVGAGLGGLAAAALVSRNNKKAIVFDPGDTAGGVLGVYKKNGFIFYPGPTLSFGFERGGTFQKLNESLGISQNASLHSPCYQVALPDRRITIYAEQSETLDELRREFPREIDLIRKFYRDLRKDAAQNMKSRFSAYLARRKAAGDVVRNYRFSREMTAFLDVQSYYFFRRPVADISLEALITLFDSTPLTVHGGFRKLAEQMVDVLLKNGGEIRYDVPLSDISARDGRPAGLSTPQGVLEADAVLFNTEQNPREAVLCLGLRDEVVPVSMFEEVLCVPDYSHPERFFSLSLGAKDDETTAPRGMRTLTAAFSSATRDQSNEARIRQISAVIPFLTQFLVMNEEYDPAPRTYPVPGGLSFKNRRTRDSQAALSRSSKKGIFMLADGAGTPAQTIATAQAFVENMS